MGRKGYADEWARENKIWLINDERFFEPCCWKHNGELENNPELSREYQLSKIHGGKKMYKSRPQIPGDDSGMGEGNETS
jgi:hypothetical protein